MKTVIVKKCNGNFKPVELRITIETEAELQMLWSHLNVCTDEASKVKNIHIDCEPCDSYHLWKQVDIIADGYLKEKRNETA